MTTNGIKQKTLESLKREILQIYGYDELHTLLSLSNSPLNLITPSPRPPTAPPQFPLNQLRKSLRLLIDAEDIPTSRDGADQVDEPDISYVYSGWAPLSIRLIQCITQKGGVYANPAAQGARHRKSGSTNAGDQASTRALETNAKPPAQPISGWKGFEEVVNNVPGDTFDFALSDGVKGRQSANGKLPNPRTSTTTTVLYFLGGVTYTEIAAIRWMARQNTGRKYLIATTGIVSGNSIMDSIAGRR